MAANAVSKILGAAFKIPLTYIVHEEGMAVYNTAFSVYAVALSFAVSGVPFAVTKLTAVEEARKNPSGAKAVVDYAVVILAIIGAAVSIVLWFGAEFFAYAMKEPHAVNAIRAVSFSVFFVAVGAAAKSGFQGSSDMTPTAVSQCIEAVIKLGAGYALAVFFVRFGTAAAAAGAIGGVTVGEIVATLMLVISYYVSRCNISRERGRRKYYVNQITNEALPVFLMSAAGAVISLVDTSVLRASLIRSGLSMAEARYLYGAYTGYAMTVLNLPSGFLASLGVSIVPVVSAAAAMGDMRKIRTATKKGIFICAGAGGLAAVVMALFPELILSILFHNTASAYMMRMAAPSVIFISVMQLLSAILQAMGYTYKTFISSVAVGVIKLLAAVFLVSQSEFNILGAAIGSDIAYCAGMVINLFFLYRAGAKGLEIKKKV